LSLSQFEAVTRLNSSAGTVVKVTLLEVIVIVVVAEHMDHYNLGFGR